MAYTGSKQDFQDSVELRSLDEIHGQERITEILSGQSAGDSDSTIRWSKWDEGKIEGYDRNLHPERDAAYIDTSTARDTYREIAGELMEDADSEDVLRDAAEVYGMNLISAVYSKMREAHYSQLLLGSETSEERLREVPIPPEEEGQATDIPDEEIGDDVFFPEEGEETRVGLIRDDPGVAVYIAREAVEELDYPEQDIEAFQQGLMNSLGNYDSEPENS